MKIYKNADFISCEDENKIYKVLVEDRGKIVYLGNDIPESYANLAQQDLGGKCVIPPFADTHIHFESFSLFHATLDCRHAADFDDLAEIIRKYIKNHPEEKVVLGFGCSAHTVREKRLPELADLDKITSHPVILIKYDGHAAVANSALIQKVPTAVSNDSGFHKDSGWFYLDAFYKVVNHLTKSVSIFKVLKNMIGGADFMARQGIGMIHTVEGVGFPLDVDVNIMQIAALELPQKFRIYFQTMNLSKVRRRKLPCIGGCFATALDGCFGSEDAALKAPYTNNPANYGNLFYSQDKVNDFIRSANRAGLQIAVHAIGDAAIEQALTAYELALKDFPREDHRHIIIHADLMNSERIERAAAAGIHIALQTPFLDWQQEPVEYLEKILGDRLEQLIPLKSMLDSGLVLASGSDGPCTIPNPVFGIHAACNHPNSAERISVLDALRMHTGWAARLSFDEKDHGTLTVGKNANFVVLDKNPLETPVNELKDIKVESLYLEGMPYTGQEGSASQFLLNCAKSKVKSFWN